MHKKISKIDARKREKFLRILADRAGIKECELWRKLGYKSPQAYYYARDNNALMLHQLPCLIDQSGLEDREVMRIVYQCFGSP